MNQLLLNSSNYDKTTHSIKLDFPFAQTFYNMEIGVSDLVMYNQFFNISTAYGNNILTVVVDDTNTDYIFTIPDGFYTFTNLNTFLQTQLKENSLYTTSAGVITYPIVFSESKTSRQNQILLNPYGSSFCYVKWNQALSKLYGFYYESTKKYPANLPSGSSSRTYTQHLISDLYKVNSIYLTCNLIYNVGFGQVNDMLIGIPTATTSFGSVINIGDSHNAIDFIPVNPQNYKYIEIKIYDQDFNKLQLIDTNFLICLGLKIKSEK